MPLCIAIRALRLVPFWLFAHHVGERALTDSALVTRIGLGFPGRAHPEHAFGCSYRLPRLCGIQHLPRRARKVPKFPIGRYLGAAKPAGDYCYLHTGFFNRHAGSVAWGRQHVWVQYLRLRGCVGVDAVF